VEPLLTTGPLPRSLASVAGVYLAGSCLRRSTGMQLVLRASRRPGATGGWLSLINQRLVSARSAHPGTRLTSCTAGAERGYRTFLQGGRSARTPRRSETN